MDTKFQHTKLAKNILRFFIPLGIIGMLSFSLAAIWVFFERNEELNKERVLRTSEKVSALLSEEINGALSASEVLANSFSTLSNRRSQVNSLLQVVLMQNNNFEGVYSIWEPNEFDQMDTAFVGLKGHDETGRFMPYWTRNEYGIVDIQASVDYETSVIGDYYVVPKKTLKKAVIDPFLYTSKGKEVFMFALVAPIKYGRNFYGVTGINLKVATIHRIIAKKNYFEGNASINVYSNNGTYVTATADASLLGKNIMDLMTDADPLLDEIAKAKQKVYIENGNIVVKTPVIAYGLYTPWMVHITLPKHYLIDREQLFVFWTLWLLGFVAWGTLLYFVYLYAHKRLNNVGPVVQKLHDYVHGIPNDLDLLQNDEIKQISDLIDKANTNNKKWVEGFEQILKKNYSHIIEPTGTKDEVSKVFNEVLKTLNKRAQDNKEKTEQAAQQKWVREGIADINKVLRLHFNSLEELSEELIKVIVDYLNINQGGLFVLVERERRKPYLELTAAYAYNRYKAMNRRINLGDGVVGTCALEREITFLTEIPDSYPVITSGLGGAVPKSILVAPLIHENMVYGVIELASFTKFEDKEIALIEEISEQIASAIASVRINAKTATLLAQLQQQQEDSKKHEKITQETINKLTKTQEQVEKTQTRLRREVEMYRMEVIRLKTNTTSSGD